MIESTVTGKDELLKEIERLRLQMYKIMGNMNDSMFSSPEFLAISRELDQKIIEFQTYGK
ncbi:aspartyl-phosphate phosphatase Spo0E family protein [Bacillus marinisedimentorum]|uniref:aspartyl-phosphate phosphatase Spo0E family protein n=1 Tax=Bacillus marinisedimentorum TaxID=1821260 RepID=UPI00087284DC|nr:aspartyl-phosphate phosphatase Spo0E family protein [Bacillus marinisedimentorum]